MTPQWKSRALTTAGLALAAVAFTAGAATYDSRGNSTDPARLVSSATSPSSTSEHSSTSGADALPTRGRALADELSLAFESAADSVAPSVVAVLSEKTLHRSTQGRRQVPPQGPGSRGFESPFDDFFRFFGRPGPGASPFGGEPRGPVRGAGSGVIVRSDGYVLTNNHVVDGADRVTVILADDRELEAEVIGTDPETDLAVIKVDATDLPAARLGDSKNAKVGMWVIAVGNPFELRHTVTAGIVSATGRSTVGLATYEDFIQTDASINPGNSGGALADLDGRVIGINTAISSPSGGNVGIGFAIPIDMAERVMADLIDDGSIERGYLALIPQDLDRSLAEAFGLENTKGALVADVTEDGPADKAGIETGDLIIGFNGNDVADSMDLRNQVAAADPGEKVDVLVLRDGRKKTIDVELGIRPGAQLASRESEQGEPRDALSRFGFEALDLTPELAEQTGYKGREGVLVSSVDPASPAGRAGLRRGDLIERVGKAAVSSVSDLDSQLAAEKNEQIALLVRRGQATLFLALPSIED